MDAGLRARIEDELPQRGWAPENHAKLVEFLVTCARPPESPRLAFFDADNTAWTGDVGDATLVFLLRNLKLSPRIAELLPASIDVPAKGFGLGAGAGQRWGLRPQQTPAGRLFPAARVQEALEAMLLAYRRVVAPSVSLADFLRAFSEEMILPGGPLHGAADFAGAYRVYTGTLLGLYNLLDAQVGSVAFDFAAARVATPLYDDTIRDFYALEAASAGDLARFTRPGKDGRDDILFPAILDEGADQRALRAQGRLGAYTQVASWVALDKTPAELRQLALRIWEGSPPVDTAYHVVFPVDPAGATSPTPISFGAAENAVLGTAQVRLGTASMHYGTRIRPEIVDLMTAMARRGVVVAVITASHVDLVQPVLERHYGFGSNPVLGMLPVLEAGRYGPDLTAPATFRPGKVDAVRAVARSVTGREDARPVFCAGDSVTDFEMVAYSGGYRLFFDRGKQPLMDLARYLAWGGAERTTLIQAPFPVAP